MFIFDNIEYIIYTIANLITLYADNIECILISLIMLIIIVLSSIVIYKELTTRPAPSERMSSQQAIYIYIYIYMYVYMYV